MRREGIYLNRQIAETEAWRKMPADRMKAWLRELFCAESDDDVFVDSVPAAGRNYSVKGRQPARRSLSLRLRFEVLKRDNFTCGYCGAHPPTAVLNVDHIVAVANGGTNDAGNLITACQNCNSGKGASSIENAEVSA